MALPPEADTNTNNISHLLTHFLPIIDFKTAPIASSQFIYDIDTSHSNSAPQSNLLLYWHRQDYEALHSLYHVSERCLDLREAGKFFKTSVGNNVQNPSSNFYDYLI